MFLLKKILAALILPPTGPVLAPDGMTIFPPPFGERG
jgi:hypothetical protein